MIGVATFLSPISEAEARSRTPLTSTHMKRKRNMGFFSGNSSSFSISIVFFVIALLSALPSVNVILNPRGGFEGWGPGVAAVILLYFVSIPSAIISCLCGAIAIPKTKSAFFTIIPTFAFLIYIADLISNS